MVAHNRIAACLTPTDRPQIVSIIYASVLTSIVCSKLTVDKINGQLINSLSDVRESEQEERQDSPTAHTRAPMRRYGALTTGDLRPRWRRSPAICASRAPIESFKITLM